MMLKTSKLHPNFSYPREKGPEYLVARRSELLDEIADRLPELLALKTPDISCFLPPHQLHRKGERRSLRFVRCETVGHQVFTDLGLQRTGEDLFLAFSTRIRSRSAWVRPLLYAVVYLILFALLNILVLRMFDISGIWMNQYRNTYLQGQVVPTEESQGLDAFNNVVTVDTTEKRFEMMQKDPYLLLKVIGPPVAVVGVLSGVLCWLLPPGSIAAICRFLEWPTPEMLFEDASAQRSHINTLVMGWLMEEYGIDGTQTRVVLP